MKSQKEGIIILTGKELEINFKIIKLKSQMGN